MSCTWYKSRRMLIREILELEDKLGDAEGSAEQAHWSFDGLKLKFACCFNNTVRVEFRPVSIRVLAFILVCVRIARPRFSR